MRLPKPLRRIPSILMERQDPILMSYERRLRRHFASTGFPEIWISPTVQAKPDHLDSRALLHMFHGWHLGQSGKVEDTVEFREVYATAQAAHLRARGLEGLTDSLMKIALDESARTGEPLDVARSEECLELCRRGIEEFQHYAWAPNVIGSFHLVHGTIDTYKGDTFTAKLHLNRALKEMEHVTTWFDRKGRKESRAWAHLFLGDVAVAESDWEEACVHYDTSQRLSKGITRIAAISRLAKIHLETLKNPTRALRVLKRATNKLNLLLEKDSLRDEIRCLTAESYYLCGRRKEALRLYRGIARDAESDAVRNEVGEWLKKVEGDQG